MNVADKLANLSPEKLALLAQRLKQKQVKQGVSRQPKIGPRPLDSKPQLSFGQQRLWFLDRLEGPSATYNVPVSIMLSGHLDTALLSSAFYKLANRHDVLRTAIVEVKGEPEQCIDSTASEVLTLVDLRHLSAGEKADVVDSLSNLHAQQPFQLDQSPLYRVHLIRLSETRHHLLLTMSHLISDGWSVDIMIRELITFYRSGLAGTQATLPPLTIQYADYAHWQRNRLEGSYFQKLSAFWAQNLAGLPPRLELPADFTRPNIQTYRGKSVSFTVPSHTYIALMKFNQVHNTTLFISLLTTFNALLARYTNQADISVGTSIANRTFTELEALIGLFINTIVMRNQVQGQMTFQEMVQQTKENSLAAYAHQEMPFEALVEQLHPERSLSHSPLFQVFFELQNTPLASLKLPGLYLSVDDSENTVSKFDMSLSFEEQSDRLVGTFEFNTDLFRPDTVARWIQHYCLLLDAFIKHPQQPLSSVQLLTQAERQLQMETWNQNHYALPDFPCFTQLWEARVADTPERIAVCMQGEELTYAQLKTKADIFAGTLAQHGAGNERVVAVLATRGFDLLGSILAIFRTGSVYLPLDPFYPPKRIAVILASSQPQVIVVERKFKPLLTQVLETLGGDHPQILYLDDMNQSIQHPLPAPITDPERLAYVIYTSGSTGTPKGAMVHHLGMINHLYAKIHDLDLSSEDVIAQNASQCFDISIWQFLVALVIGGKTLVVNDEVARDPALLLDEVYERSVTVLEVVPSLLRFMLEHLATCGRYKQSDHLRWLVPTGEALPPDLCRDWLERFPHTPVVNAYGPTECSDDVSHHQVDEPPPASCNNIPIGKPIINTHLYILDPHLNGVPIGVSGQLFVGGICLGRGYMNNPIQTAKTFIPNPFATQPGERLYRTGDLSRFLPDGVIEFLGRVDFQAKLRGFRLELDEVQAQLRLHQDVAEAIVLVQPNNAGEDHLVAYVTAGEGNPDPLEVRDFVAERLPHYMVPSAFVILEAMPLIPNGKIDRAALRVTGENVGGIEESNHTPPQGPTESYLAKLWEELLNVSQIGRFDNFFNVGGHSLLATRVLARVQDKWDVTIPLLSFFETPSLDALAEKIENAAGSGQDNVVPLKPAPEGVSIPLSFSQQRLWFLDQLEGGTVNYHIPDSLRLLGSLDIGAIEKAFNIIASRHKVLQTAFGQVDGQPVQSHFSQSRITVDFCDLSALMADMSQDQQDAYIQDVVCKEAIRPFDLTRPPLLRVRLFRLEETSHVLTLTTHHIVSDGWSMGILVGEFGALYEASLMGQSPQLSASPLQFSDYAYWQRQWLNEERREQHATYWKQKLAGLPPLLELPTDRPRPTVMTANGSTRTYQYPAQLCEALNALCKENGGTLFMGLLSAFKLLLARYSGQSDLAIGSVTANRDRPELENMIGFFANTVVFRSQLDMSDGFAALFKQVKTVTLETYKHQELPFEHLVDIVNPVRSMSHTPIFQVMFLLDNMPMPAQQLPGLHIQPVAHQSTTAKFDLNLNLIETHDGLSATMEYNTDLFDGSTVDRMLRHLHNLLTGLCAAPHMPLTDVSMLSADERRQAMCQWNETQAVFPTGLRLEHLLVQQAERHPEAVALVFEERQLTYGQLLNAANEVAERLVQRGAEPNQLVAVAMDKSLEQVIATFGVLFSGAAYLPLDMRWPQQRRSEVLEIGEVSLLLSSAEHLEANRSSTTAECLLVDSQQIPASATVHHRENIEDLAYVIFTSGSTGKPKGVMIRHRAVVNTIHDINASYSVGPEDRVLALSALSFDLSVYDLFGVLGAGGSVVIPHRDTLLDPQHWALLIKRHSVTLWNTVPALMDLLVSCGSTSEYCLNESIRLVMLSGDWIPVTLPDRIREQNPNAKVISMGGATEASIWSIFYPIGDVSPDWSSIPYGKPMANQAFYVLDQNLEPCPIGVTGELYIGGIGLADGYWRDDERTCASFFTHPKDSMPLYRTGDLGGYQIDGTIEFRGRADFQVKINGYRIELGDVESALEAHPQVEEAIVTVYEDNGTRHLVGYVIPTEQAGELQTESLRETVRTHLPEYMTPHYYMVLEHFPLNANGKVDRKALPSPEIVSEENNIHVAPTTHIEQVLSEIWASLLGRERVGLTDNFFELGGDSILAIQVIAQARRHQIGLTPRLLFEHQTIAELAPVATQAMVESRQGVIAGEVPLSPISHWFFDRVHSEKHHFNQALMVCWNDPIDKTILTETLSTLLAHHDVMRSRFYQEANQWRQEILSPEMYHQDFLQEADLQHVSQAELKEQIERLAQNTQASLSLDGHLTRFLWIKTPDSEQDRLLMVFHHLVMDGVSWRILLEDLEMTYSRILAGKEAQLPPKSTDVQVWSQKLGLFAQSERLYKQASYWLDAEKEKGAQIPLDPPLGDISTIQSLTVELDQTATDQLLHQAPSAYNTEINDLLLTTLISSVGRLTGNYHLWLDLEGHGREDFFEDVDLSRTVGWFTSIFPVTLNISGEQDTAKIIKTVKEQLRAIPMRGMPYGILRYCNSDPQTQATMEAIPTPQIVFNYLGQVDQGTTESGLFRFAPESPGAAQGQNQNMLHGLEIGAMVRDDRLSLEFSFTGSPANNQIIAQLGQSMIDDLHTLIKHCLDPESAGFTPSDFPNAQVNQDQLEEALEELAELDELDF